jgi:hypothetical protein
MRREHIRANDFPTLATLSGKIPSAKQRAHEFNGLEGDGRAGRRAARTASQNRHPIVVKALPRSGNGMRRMHLAHRSHEVVAISPQR